MCVLVQIYMYIHIKYMELYTDMNTARTARDATCDQHGGHVSDLAYYGLLLRNSV